MTKKTTGQAPPLEEAEVRDLLSDAALNAYEALPRDAQDLVGRALGAALPVLQRDPSQLVAQLYGRLSDLDMPALRLFLEELAGEAHGVLLPRTRTLPSPVSPLLRELSGHTNFVGVLLFLPDGRLLSASEDGSMRLWNLRRGSSRVLKGHPGPINTIALSPDGTLLATGSDDCNIALWNAKGPKRLGILRGHTHYVRDVGFTPDGKYLVSASDDGTMRLWEVPEGEGKVLVCYSQAITAMAISPQEPLAALATMDNTLRLVDLTNGQERVLYDCSKNFIGTVMGMSLGARNRSGVGHENFAKVLLFSHDGETLYSAEESLIAWDVREGKQIQRWKGHSWPISGLALSSDGSRIATAAESVMIWDLTGSEEPTRLGGHTARANTALFLPEDRSLLVGYEDGRIKHWDLLQPTSLAMSPGHQQQVWSLSLSPDGKLLASGGADKSAILWEVETGREIGRIEDFEDVFVYAFSWSLDGQRLYATSGKDFKEWDVTSRSLLGTRHWTNQPYLAAHFLETLPDGRLLAAGYGDGLLCWSADGEATFLSGYKKQWSTTALVLSRDREFAFHAAYHDDEELPGTVWRWDLRRGEITQELKTPGEYISKLVLSEGGRFLIGGGSAGGVYVWDAETGALCHRLEGFSQFITSLVALPGERLLASAPESPVCEWDLTSGALRRQLLSLQDCSDLCVSRDGTRLAARRQETVFLLDVESTTPLASFTGSSPISHICLSPDGGSLIAGERSGAVHILRFFA